MPISPQPLPSDSGGKLPLASQAVVARASEPGTAPPSGPLAANGTPPDGFRGSQELGEAGGAQHPDIKSMVDAFGAAHAPPTAELEQARRQGKTGADLVGERKRDQDIVDHVCGEGCGCVKTQSGADPLKTLQDRDDEVRKHENDHLVEAGEFAVSGPQFDTQQASNGRSFVTGGKVHVNIGEVEGDPLKTIQKMKKLEKAARKPAEPSDQDLRVAAEAAGKRSKAEIELAAQRRQAQEDQRNGVAPTRELPAEGAESV